MPARQKLVEIIKQINSDLKAIPFSTFSWNGGGCYVSGSGVSTCVHIKIQIKMKKINSEVKAYT